MERAIDPLQTIDAKLWADEFMATKQRLGDAEFDHAMMLGWFANAIMRGYDEGKRLGAADAQATIAALQARVQELEQWVQDQSTANLETMRHMDEMQSRAMEAESQLTQRTAELEAANGSIEAARQVNNDLQAELERVRADNKALDEWRADVTVSLQRPGGAFFVDVPQHIKDLVKERDDLRTLLLALPKVEGAVVVSNGYVKDSTRCHALFGADEDAALYVALLQHRQGMEG